MTAVSMNFFLWTGLHTGLLVVVRRMYNDLVSVVNNPQLGKCLAILMLVLWGTQVQAVLPRHHSSSIQAALWGTQVHTALAQRHSSIIQATHHHLEHRPSTASHNGIVPQFLFPMEQWQYR